MGFVYKINLMDLASPVCFRDYFQAFRDQLSRTQWASSECYEIDDSGGDYCDQQFGFLLPVRDLEDRIEILYERGIGIMASVVEATQKQCLTMVNKDTINDFKKLMAEQA